MTCHPSKPLLINICLTIVPVIPLIIAAALTKHYTIDAWGVHPPRARKRKRRLTLPFCAESTGNEIGYRARFRELVTKTKTEQQNGYGFFTLPLEVREMVYKEYICDGKIWIVLPGKGKLRGFRNIGFNVENSEGIEVMPLLLACRRIYSEIAPFIYSLPTFTFLDTISFLTFSASIVPPRFHNIRKIHLDMSDTPPEGLIPTWRHAMPNQPLRKSYKFVRRASSRFHTALPSEQLRKEKNKALWHKMIEVLAAMQGLRRLAFSADIKVFDYFHELPSMWDPDEALCLRGLLIFGMSKEANIRFQILRSRHEEMKWQELSEEKWRSGLEDGQSSDEIEEWRERMAKFRMKAFDLQMELNAK